MKTSRDWKQEPDLGVLVRLLRETKGLTQRGLQQVGIKKSYLANLETGNIENPSPKMIGNIARGLGVKTNDLVKGTKFELAVRAGKRPARAFCPNNLCPKLQLNHFATGMIIPYRFSIERLQAGEDKLFEVKFCSFCGKKLLSHCPKCREPILVEDPEQTHCVLCGERIFEKLTEEQVMAGDRE